MLSEKESRQLLTLARDSIETYFSRQEPDTKDCDHLKEKQGVFVTLHKHGDLRGCIGFPYPTLPLFKGIIEGARAAAFEDPRFPDLKEDELKEIDIEISVLTVPEEIKTPPEQRPEQIKIGEDGLIIKNSFTSGLLLPQVFTEYDCTPERALEMTCQKAGLPTHAWKDSSVKILKFQAQILSEQDVR
ncbi:AmmeMemoRadiSam system protein A [Nanoarchaeota archaeon]